MPLRNLRLESGVCSRADTPDKSKGQTMLEILVAVLFLLALIVLPILLVLKAA